MERAAGLEPTSPAGLAGVLPVELCTQKCALRRCRAALHFLGSALRRFSVGCFILAAFVGAPARFRLCVSGPVLFRGASVSGPAWPVGISRHRRETVAVSGLPPSRAGRLGFRFGCGRCRTTWPPRCWSAFCHAAAVLGRCFLPFSAVFCAALVPKRNATPDFFCLSSEKTTRLPRPVQGEASGSTFWPSACQLLPFCLNSPGPAAASLL